MSDHTNIFRVYTGPCSVKRTAERIQERVFHVLQGTENIYVTTNKDVRELLAVLNEMGNGWNLRDIHQIH
jgi:hypothetical protein